jgi:ribosome-binding factor A
MKDRRGRQAPSQRQLRVGEEIRHALADVLSRADFRDPTLRSLNITVTEVRVSPDLRNATAFVTPLGSDGADAAAEALGRAAAFLRAHVARAVRLQYVPKLSFAPDTSFAHASAIERLLHKPSVERDLAHRDNDDDPSAMTGPAREEEP